jgi:hypothetical protein
MKLNDEKHRNLGGDKDEIRIFYRTEEPETTIEALLNPASVGLDEEGHRFLKDLMEDSICLEQHIAFAGWSAELESKDPRVGAVDPRTAEVFKNITYDGMLYEGEGRGSCAL